MVNRGGFHLSSTDFRIPSAVVKSQKDLLKFGKQIRQDRNTKQLTVITSHANKLNHCESSDLT